MERITVDKHNLNLLIDDIEELVNWAYKYGYTEAYNKED